MRNLVTAIIGLIFLCEAYGQALDIPLIETSYPDANQNWYSIKGSVKHLNKAELVNNLNYYLNLNENNSFQLINEKLASDQWMHYKFQQYFNGIKVLGATVIVHEYDGVLKSLNGRKENIQQLDTKARLAPNELARISQINFPEIFIGDLNPNQHFTNQELLIMDSNYPKRSGDFILAYKIDYNNHDLFRNRRFYIDALSGQIILSYDLIQSCFSEKGTAQTLYHGDQDMECELIVNEYQLLDYSRGNGIETMSESGRTYNDPDNYWQKGSLAQRRGALDIQFGSQKTIDFYKQYFNRDGIDGKNLKLVNKLRDSVNLVNAYWNNTGTLYGRGDSINTGPITSIDVVGHELTHGVTQFTCGLEYLYESGALNEGLSDIFGKAIEFEYDSARFNWLLGGRPFVKKDTAFRNMADPNHYRNPKMYKGKFWVSNASDNGGVHTNSGVINYWFYLLSVGGTGTNEAGQTYNVAKFGMIPTLKILYDAMDNYLTSTSFYYDIREVTLLIAEKNYGKCSFEYLNISEAWKAVGLGRGVKENDVQLVNNKITQVACKEGLFPVEIKLVNLSCDQAIPVGTDIVFSIAVPQKNKIIEYYTTTETILPGASFNYNFINPARIDRNVSIVVEAVVVGDVDTSNNRLSLAITKNANSDHDFRVQQIQINGSSCENNSLRARVFANYTGCSPVPVGTELTLQLNIDNQQLIKTFKTATTLFPGNQFQSVFFDLDRIFSGYKRILGVLDYVKDTVDTNNSAYFNAVYIDNVKFGYLEPFTSGQFDSTLLGLKLDSFQSVNIQADFLNSEAITFTGGKLYNNANQFIPSNAGTLADFISSNPKFTSTMYLCLETKDLVKATLSFDYLQKLGAHIYDSIITSSSFVTGIRIQYRNEMGALVGMPSYLQNGKREALSQYFEQEIPLTGGAITIEITNICLNGVLDTLNFKIDTSADLVVFDNIKIDKVPVKNNDVYDTHLFVEPNPFNDNLNVYIEPSHGKVSYFIINELGVTIQNGILNPSWNQIETSRFPSGIYFITTHTANKKLHYTKILKY